MTESTGCKNGCIDDGLGCRHEYAEKICAEDEIMSDPLIYKIELPIRRYAIFEDLLYGKYTVVVRGADIATAPMWGGFVGWLGGVKEAVSRSGKITKPLAIQKHERSHEEEQ